MRVCQERSDQKVGSESLYSGVLFQVLVLIHYNALTQKPISVFLCDICAHSLTVKSEGEYKILNGIFPLSNMTYLPEEILQFKLAINIKVWFISQLPGLLHTQDFSLCSQSFFTTPSYLENLASYSIHTPKDSTTYTLVLQMVCNLLSGNQVCRLPLMTSVNKLPPRIDQKDKPGKYKIIFREKEKYGSILSQNQ